MASQTQLVIPPRLDVLLGTSELAQVVRSSLARFAGWIGAQDLFFFPEYTDHGPLHVNRVLAAAAALVTEKAWDLLTAEDAAVLVLGALLHDSGMHLTADGLLDLLAGRPRPLIQGLDTKTWDELFGEFFSEAQRWDDRTLYRVLGDRTRPPAEQPDLTAGWQDPRLHRDSDTWTARGRKLLGEFVRRHHARLAHEIALFGVPGPLPDRLDLALEPHLAAYRDLAGLVARSHGLPLRECFRYLRERFDGYRTCRKTHPIFLMVLLRIADYLEIDAERANRARLLVQRLRSPISQEEWEAHLAVAEVRQDEEDPEAIFVVAEPKSAGEFLKLQRLFFGLQKELDTSWAVLGEVFGRQDDLSSLGLRLRRVRSNLDDTAEFVRTKNPDYYPLAARFEAAGTAFLKVLVGPLYGDPVIGVRELLQNAVDAVRELSRYMAVRGEAEMRGLPMPEQAADVLIAVETDDAGRNWLTVSDKGIGMTAETVRDYFLRAGASFRDSEAWRREFAPQGRSTVLRSGRFGVGALAAFLLGPRIEVHTRHVSASREEAVYFTASFAEDGVALLRKPKETVGTWLRLELGRSGESLLESAGRWDWYTLDSPRVERLVRGKALDQRYHLPLPEQATLPGDWRRILPKGFEACFWSFDLRALFVVNGIGVGRGAFVWSDELVPWDVPSLSVFDPDGRVPLTLRRDGIQGHQLPAQIEEPLLRDMTIEICAFLLAHATEGISRISPWLFPGLLGGFWEGRNGVSLRHPWHLRSAGVRRALLLTTDLQLKPGVLRELNAVFWLADSGWTWQEVGDALSLPIEAGFIVRPSTRRRDWKIMREDPRGREIAEEQASSQLGMLLKTLPPERLIEQRCAELLVVPGYGPPLTSPIVETWREILGDEAMIPFDPAARQDKFGHAYTLIQDRIELWLRPEGWRRQWLDMRGAHGAPPRPRGRSTGW